MKIATNNNLRKIATWFLNQLVMLIVKINFNVTVEKWKNQSAKGWIITTKMKLEGNIQRTF